MARDTDADHEERSGAEGDPPNPRWIATALAYVPHVARRYIGCGVAYDELLAAGNLGLVEAALRYQPSRNVKFVTYADWWIRKSIFKALEEQTGPVRLPRYRREQLRTLSAGRRAWRRENGSEPDAEQLASTTGMSAEDVERLRGLGSSAVSLEEPTVPGGDRPLAEVLTSDKTPGPQDSLIRHDLMRHIRSLVAGLSAKERRVVMMRFGFDDDEPMTLRQIGREMGISRERVRQLERRALIELRNSL